MQEWRRQLIEQSREVQRVQQGKSELEHRARALEAQLQQVKANWGTPQKRSKEIEVERIEQREREHDRAQKRDKKREEGRDGDGD